MRRALVIIPISFLVIIGWFSWSLSNREDRFLEDAFVQLRGGDGNEHVETVEFDSGGSATVILEHACCSGAGFDLVAIRTSGGLELVSKENFCGLEGFSGEVFYRNGRGKHENLEELVADLKARGFTIKNG